MLVCVIISLLKLFGWKEIKGTHTYVKNLTFEKLAWSLMESPSIEIRGRHNNVSSHTNLAGLGMEDFLIRKYSIGHESGSILYEREWFFEHIGSTSAYMPQMIYRTKKINGKIMLEAMVLGYVLSSRMEYDPSYNTNITINSLDEMCYVKFSSLYDEKTAISILKKSGLPVPKKLAFFFFKITIKTQTFKF